MATEGAQQELKNVIRTFPIIDNHAHNLLFASELESEPFESITTEARGWALEDTHTSLSHIRASRQLAELYGCEEASEWGSILKKRAELIENGYDELIRRCLQGTYSILIDDGLGGISTKCHPYQWHNQFTTAPCKQILRIETLAESIMESTLKEAHEELISEDFLAGTWVVFTGAFQDAINDAIQDPAVAGFKSVVCYRTGLDVEPDYEDCLLRVGKSFERYATRCIKKREFRIKSKSVNDFLVVKTMELLSTTAPAGEMSKPIQFHTGLGDNDINLLHSNPAYLQPLIEQYTNVPLVILHSAYPYTREAGYLATMFKHVYLDLGEVFPMLSKDGQVNVVRQAFELTPYSKLLWSTDGHFFPETYWLANKQFREVLETVLVEYAHSGQLSEAQAIDSAKAVLFDNSNRLYRLSYFPPGARRGSLIAPRPQLLAASPVAGASQLASARRGTSASAAGGMIHSVYNTTALETFLQLYPVKYVYVQWLDYMATMRTRMFPVAEFSRIVHSGSRIGISRGNTGTLQNDGITAAVNTTGQIYIEPDLRSLRPTAAEDPLAPAATVMSFWRDESGDAIKECPRGGLANLLQQLNDEYKISLLVGFEIEVVFLRRNSENDKDPYLPLTTNHAWGTLSVEEYSSGLPLLAEMLDSLSSVGIEVQNFHSESGPGQYEFVLPPLQPLAAIDQLVQTRNIIVQVAEHKGLRATLHPSPFSRVGTAAHTHISLNPSDSSSGPPLTAIPQSTESAFWAGVLAHLEAICAFTMPEAESYKRVVEDGWTGGTWICWGTQNRETPLRKVGGGRWEVRCVDGFANMFLALSAIVAAGLLGLRNSIELPRDCEYNPARLTDEQRSAYGTTRRMPKDIETAIQALEQDEELTSAISERLVQDFVTMKKEEQKMLGEMPADQRRIWLIERY